MLFTDKDIKDLEETLEESGDFYLDEVATRALLRRLKATEHLLLYISHLSHCGVHDKDDCTCGLVYRLKSYCKAKGAKL